MAVPPPFYPILDTATLDRRGVDPIAFAEGMLEGGAKWLQFRQKDQLTETAFGLLEAVADRARAAGALLIVNDRADLAGLLQAGLHLGQDDLPPREARSLLSPRHVIGYSTHNAEQLRASAGEPIDYVALGPIFGTHSKQNPDPLVGLEQLAAWRRLTILPLVAIGGITRATAQAVLEAGADSVAIIGDAVPERGTRRDIRARAEEWMRITQEVHAGRIAGQGR